MSVEIEKGSKITITANTVTVINYNGENKNSVAHASGEAEPEANPPTSPKAKPKQYYVVWSSKIEKLPIGIYNVDWEFIAKELPKRQLFGAPIRLKKHTTLELAVTFWKEKLPDNEIPEVIAEWMDFLEQ